MADKTKDTIDGRELPSMEDTVAAVGPEGAGKSAIEQGSLIGRYVVLGRLGAGAMGIVLSAYDPELDRKIAVKLLEPRGRDRPAARARLQREAQALAKLSHPNVVAVHDVGEHDSQVFVAMEFVDGQTLRAWHEAKERSWREVLDVFHDAGRGLAAAHQRGLIHRDFKPDNVMIGADGRVRVMDFGLARAGEDWVPSEATPAGDLERNEQSSFGAELTRTGAMMGTPAYMAPEQFEGGEVTGKADQFAFCVALHESLFGERPFGGESIAALAFNATQGQIKEPSRRHSVPTWLRRLVRRGLSPQAKDRFSSMDALLAAMSLGETKRKRRRWLVLATAALAVVAAPVGVARWDHAAKVGTCEAEGAAIDQSWNETSRASVRAGLIATEVPYAPDVADKVTFWIDHQVRNWRTHATAACLASDVEQTWTPAKSAKARWCLEERRIEVETLIDDMAHADMDALQAAVQAASTLAPVVVCVDEASLAGMPAPPPLALRPELEAIREQSSRVTDAANDGDITQALELGADVIERADLVDWKPVAARARNEQAVFLKGLGRVDEAEAVALDAYVLAAESGTWEVAAATAIHLVYIIGYLQQRTSEGKVWSRHAQVAITHAGDPLGLWEAHRLNNLGTLHQAAGELDDAKLVHRRALEIRKEVLGPAHHLVGESLNNLGNVHFKAKDPVEGTRLVRLALDTLVDSLGPENPTVGMLNYNLGFMAYSVEDYDLAIRHLERAAAIGEGAYGPSHLANAGTLSTLAKAHEAMGDPAAAQVDLGRAITILEANRPEEHPELQSLREDLARLKNSD